MMMIIILIYNVCFHMIYLMQPYTAFRTVHDRFVK